MNSLISIFVGVLLIGIMIKRISYIKKLKIPTKKSVFENLIFITIITAIVIMIILFGKYISHYVAGTLFVIYFIISFLKQGISEEGIVIVNRGKEFFSWSEIKEVEIQKNSSLKITFFEEGRLEIVTHNFAADDYEKVFEILNSHNVKINTKYN